MSDDFTAAEGCHDMKDIPPWPHSVIGAEVLNEIAGTFTSKLAPVPHAADAFSLYVLFTHWCSKLASTFLASRSKARPNASSSSASLALAGPLANRKHRLA